MAGKDSKLKCIGCDPGLSIAEREKLLLNGVMVEVSGLDDLMEKVRRSRLSKRKEIADELLSLAKAINEIPEDMERSYRDALMDEYDRRYLSIM